MVPDLGLFLPVSDYAQAHSFVGAFAVCLPMGMALFLLFELVLRAASVAMLPKWMQCRTPHHPQLPVELSSLFAPWGGYT